MSDLEALMWTLEADPHLSSNFANITFFDRLPDVDRLRSRLQRASRAVPRLRRRVVPGLGLLAPAWAEDPDFDVDNHLRLVTLPDGSTEADARALATDLALRPFDDTRPLWEFTVIDGLPDGRAAMVQKMHHTITDGEGGIRMSVEFIDMERNPAEPPPLDDPAPAPAGQPLALDLVSTLWRTAGDAVRSAQDRASAAVEHVLHPAQLASVLAELPSESAATVRSIVRQYGVTGSYQSPLWTERSLQRSLEVFDVPLDAVKDAAHALGGSVNDLFVAAAAGGAGAYHRDRGHEAGDLRMNMPVSTRTNRASGGNSFAPSRVLVPVDADPRQRFSAIHDRLTVAKTERSMGLFSSLAGIGRLVPKPALLRLARQQVMTVDFTTSNVRAAPFDLYIGGALMLGNYPLGPIMGTAWNLTTMSYRGQLNCGLHVDTAAVPEPAALSEAIQASFAELLALAR